jgi:hypothetical protein
MRSQRRQGGLQGLDRVGPLGGQVLGGSATGSLELQVVLKLSDPVISRLVGGSMTRGPGPLLSVGYAGLAWSQTGCQQVLGWNSPEPTLTGGGARLLLGGWEASGGQVAADRRGRDPAHPSRFSDRQARPRPRAMPGVGKMAERLPLGMLTTVAVIRRWLPGAHDTSLSRSVRS